MSRPSDPEHVNAEAASASEAGDTDRRASRRVGSSRDRAIRQAHDILRASLRRGLLGPDSPLVEFKLIASLGIGRNAVRAALQKLADEGVVVRRPGVGTLAARPMLRVSADEILDFDAAFGDPRQRVDVKQISTDTVRIGEGLTQTLGLPSGVMRVLESLVSVDREPICLLEIYLPAAADPSKISSYYESIAVSFSRVVGVSLARTTTTVEAVAADPYAAEVLHVPPGAPLVLREQVLTGTDGNVGVLIFARYRADRVAFVTTVDAPV